MDTKGLFGSNYDAVNRGMFSGTYNPFTGYQSSNKFTMPYQFPAAASDTNVFDNPFTQLHDTTNGFGLKYGAGGGGAVAASGYGHSSMGGGGGAAAVAQTHYGPPIVAHSSGGGGKGGKLKGAALSALTLLAFLYFLNLLQSCLKDQMDAMNPTVMVMSAGQRTFIGRNENESKKRFDQNYENTASDEQQQQQLTEYDNGDYNDEFNADDVDDDDTNSHKRIRAKQQKRRKSKAHMTSATTVRPKLQNLQIIRSSM